mmetsp:Transcript_20274/g.33171  ORF Transcript_20274/g.33171 Transcript_20274/m.33171 type:complete len:129 (+) Transcript_20274:562-948(+)
MILLSEKLTGKMKDGQEIIGGLNATVHRNYFGSQLGSFSADLDHMGGTYKAVFIRAPVIVEHGDNVEVLAKVVTERASKEASQTVDQVAAIVAAKQDNILVTSFHPELTEDTQWHDYFHSMVVAHINR